MTYLVVRGTVFADRFVPRLGRETPEPPRIEPTPNAISLALLDDSDALIAAAGTAVALPIDAPRSPVAPFIRGAIELVPGATQLAIVVDGEVIHVAPVAAEAPRVSVDEVNVDGDMMQVQWSVTSQYPVICRVALVMPDGRQIPVARDLTTHSGLFDLGAVPRSDGARVTVIASDGVRSGAGSSEPVAIRGVPPSCKISRPDSRQPLQPYQSVTLMGSAREADGNELSVDGLEWHIDGTRIAAGTNLAATSPLDPGPHLIELHHRDLEEPARLTIVVEDAGAEWEALRDRGLPPIFADADQAPPEPR